MKTLIKLSVLLLASASSTSRAAEVSPYLEASTVVVAKVAAAQRLQELTQQYVQLVLPDARCPRVTRDSLRLASAAP